MTTQIDDRTSAQEMAISSDRPPEVREFDYNNLATETRDSVLDLTAKIKERVKHLASDIVEIGRHMSEAKVQLKHGQFGKWLKAEFPAWSQATAENFMAAARLVDEIPKFLEFRHSITDSALYLLGAGSTPLEVCEEIIERASSGQRINTLVVRQALMAYGKLPCSPSPSHAKPSRQASRTAHITNQAPPAAPPAIAETLPADDEQQVTTTPALLTIEPLEHSQKTVAYLQTAVMFAKALANCVTREYQACQQQSADNSQHIIITDEEQTMNYARELYTSKAFDRLVNQLMITAKVRATSS